MIDFSKPFTKSDLYEFAEWIIPYAENIGYKVSSRGWCYLLESERMVNKDGFDKVENIINRCRKFGILPIDFVAEEPSREFDSVYVTTKDTPLQWLKGYLESALYCERWYTPDWHDGEEYYIQMVVEKIDLKTLFTPVCEKYHIPIANSKGWSSMLQRAEYSRRFKEAENRGMKCVLLYCGDHDPDGLRISDFIMNNLTDLAGVQWSDGLRGYNPDDLIIDRFGLNYDFIQANKLTWIDNLITGSGKNLASPTHKNHKLPYVKQYIKQFGTRKCEANAIMPKPIEARKLVEDVIISYLGTDAISRFNAKLQLVKDEISDFRIKTGLIESIQSSIQLLEDNES